MNKSTTRQDESRQRFKVGSQAFFDCMPGFKPGDIDEIEFEENPKLYKNFMQFRKKDKTRCLFKWRKMSVEEFIEYTLNTKLPMEVGKFLVPEVAEYLGFTIDDLRRLAPIIARLDEKHKYEQIIFESYLENGCFELTYDQRSRAYEAYKCARDGYQNNTAAI